MKFPQNFLAGAGVLTAGAEGEITEVCTALSEIVHKNDYALFSATMFPSFLFCSKVLFFSAKSRFKFSKFSNVSELLILSLSFQVSLF